MRQLKKSISLSACALAASLLISACGGGSATDSDAPTATITGAASTVVEGNTTFTLEFSESVGKSLSAEDLVVTGGTASSFTRVTDTKYTVEVTPTGSTASVLTLPSGKVFDLANNGNTVAFSSAVAVATSGATGTCATSSTSQCVGFSESVMSLSNFGQALTAAIVDDPVDATNKVAKYVKSANSPAWDGATIDNSGTSGGTLTPPVAFSVSKVLTLRVYSPAAGRPIALKVENATNPSYQGGPYMQVTVNTTKANAWETLTFDFSNLDSSGGGAYDASAVFNRVSILPDTVSTSRDGTFYFDELKYPLAPVSGATTNCTTTSTKTCIGFNESVMSLSNFGQALTAVIVNDPVDATNKVAKYVKSANSPAWDGATIDNSGTSGGTLTPPVAFSVSKVLTLRVYSPAAGRPIALKVENATNPSYQGGPYMQVTVNTTKANAWETLTFDFSNLDSSGGGAYDASAVFNRVSILPDTVSTSRDGTFYFDELTYSITASSDGGGSSSGSTSSTLPITFDETSPPGLVNFGGTSSSIDVDPTVGTNKVVKVTKPVSSQQWAGTTVAQINFNAAAAENSGANAISTIPFTTSRKTMTLRVYSPAAGVRVHLKVENASNVNINSEQNAMTTAANAWETLSFNFADASTMYLPNGATTYNTSLPTSPFNLLNTYNKASVFFDFGRGNGGYADMPAERVYYFDDLTLAP